MNSYKFLMEAITLFFFIAFATLIPETTSQFNLPKIIPKYNEVVFESKWNLTLGCIGVEPVTWTLPDSIPSKRKFIIQPVNISRKEANDNEYLFGSLLTITEVSTSDVGYYTCHGVTTNKYNPTRAKNIYVYVRDENKLFVSKENWIRMKYSIHLNVTLPCIPTSPDVSVILMKQKNGNFYEVPTNFATFNSHAGFNFRIMDSIFDDYICVFTRNNKIQNLTIQLDPEDVSTNNEPYIDVPDTYILKYISDDLELNCSLIVDEDSTFNVDWDVPSISRFHTNKINIMNYRNIPIKKNKVLLTKLTIRNLTVEDEGQYKCFVGPDYKDDIYQTVNLTIIERNFTFKLPKINSESKRVVINSNTTHLTINSNEDLILHCQSEKNITWSYPNPKLEETLDLDEYFSIKNSITIENKTIIFHSRLFLKNSHYFNGGFYYCHEIGAGINDPFKSSKLYVFVRDEVNLILPPIKSEHVFTSSYNFWLPCIPTSPDVKVNSPNFELSELEYDPRFGFKLNISLVPDTGLEVLCEFDRGDAYMPKQVYIQADRNFDYELETNIIAPENEFVFTTKNLVLTCTVVVNTMKDISVVWSTPSLNNSRNRISNKFIRIHNGKILISTLIVENVELKDEGTYKCYLKNEQSSSVYIKVKPMFTAKPYIDAPATIVGDILVMHCNILFDHNTLLNLKWNNLNNQDSRIVIRDVRYIPQIKNILGTSTLIIENVTLQDQQYNYSCSAFYDKTKISSVSTQIIVQEPAEPIIYDSNMNNNKIQLKLGDPIVFTCFVQGIPEPEIIWTKDEKVIKENDLRLTISQNRSVLTVDHVRINSTGIYTCNATNRLGSKVKSMNVVIQLHKPMSVMFIIIIVVIIIIMTIFTVVCSFQLHKMKKFRKKIQMLHFHAGNLEMINNNENINDQLELLPYENKWELPRNKIKLRNQLGAGNFGLVMKANLIGTNKEVAVKLIKNCFDFTQVNLFLAELKIMTYVGKHINVINLIGACTENITNGELLIVLDYCKFGNLRNYLLTNRNNFLDLINRENKIITNTAVDINTPDRNTTSNNCRVYYNINPTIKDASYVNILVSDDNNHISTKDLMYWSYQISQGMEYLSCRKILHGDLAARNILLTENNIIKICDFGLSKNLYNSNHYKKKKQIPLPIKWMAIESIRYGIFSTHSDVWSFGIVLWELFSLGRTPYTDLEVDEEFCKKLISGHRMEQPQYASEEIYKIMLDCWDDKPSSRPSFTKLVNVLQDYIETDTRNQYAEFNISFKDIKKELKEGENNYLFS